MIITKFKKEYLANPGIKLFWSELLSLHYVGTDRGLKFEDGTFISKERLDRDLPNLNDDMVKAYYAAVSVFKDSGVRFV